ncbi:unnamed protein product [Mycena citricolor]|uniref:galacturonan 1,4-alpha-galacturonidase n=1 Tax=Mycena citricolor TaxID=2018698 RepID=A0AAD2K852_9AGAR|nr:unnamed protein product [Mycena citricolor]
MRARWVDWSASHSNSSMRFHSSSLISLLVLLPSALSQSCTLTALGAGKDDSPQFLSAMQSCPLVTVPSSTTLNISSPLNMTGLSNRHLNLQGTIKFNPNVAFWTAHGFPFTFQTQITFWILGGTNIQIDGGGVIDGSGQVWYDGFAKSSSLARPIILTLFQATNVIIQNVRMINSPEWFNFVNEGKNVTFNNVNLTAVSTSKNPAKNTDGWDIYRSDTVTIKNSFINNGDDCVSFKPNATNMIVSHLNCNGSHGISVGSLGQFAGMFDIVENVIAEFVCPDIQWLYILNPASSSVTMSNAQNGARIKAWAGAGVGSGIVKNITFSNFIESNVDHPIVIDQCYMTSASDCTKNPSNVFIQDVFFNSISGTGSSATVATLSCSPGARCSDVNVNNITLTGKKKTQYTCQNVQLGGSSASLFGTCTST